MAKKSKAKKKSSVKPAKTATKSADKVVAPAVTPVADLSADALEHIFGTLHKMLAKHAPPFKAAGGSNIDGKKDYHLMVPKQVVIQGSYGNKPTDIAMASLILQKDFVGFYFMPIYLNPELKKSLPATLLKLLKGKTCFHVKGVDEQLVADVEAALALGLKSFKDRDWV